MKEKTQKTAEIMFSLLWKLSLFRGPDCYKFITQNGPKYIKFFKAKPPMATLKKDWYKICFESSDSDFVIESTE